MNEDVEIKSDKIVEILIGILLIMPMYILFVALLNWLNLNNGNQLILLSILIPTVMCLPIVVGIALSYKLYQNKISKSISLCILIFLVLAIYFFYNTYFVECYGLEGVLLWLINASICRTLSCVFYGMIVGWKKAMIFFIIYIFFIVQIV